MPYSTDAIFGKRLLQQLSAGDYVDWAGEMLMQDFDSYNLRILAGHPRSGSVHEAEGYFLRCANEIGLVVPDGMAAVRAYASEVAQEVIEGRLSGQDGVRALYQICLATNYEEDFRIWLELDDVLDNLLCGAYPYPYTYETATLDNFEQVVRQEAGHFIKQMKARTAT